MKTLVVILSAAVPSPPSFPSRTRTQIVTIAKPKGVRLSVPGYTGLAAMRTELTGSGVPVVAVHCASPGRTARGNGLPA